MSIDVLAQYALAATAFIQFKAPDGSLIFAKKKDTDDEGNEILVDDQTKPIGVNMVAPGTKEHRAAEDAAAKLARQRAEKLTKKEREAGAMPSLFVWIGTEKAARMVTEFVGFDYNGKGASVENTLAFLNDPKWTLFADQIRSATGDHERFLPKE